MVGQQVQEAASVALCVLPAIADKNACHFTMPRDASGRLQTVNSPMSTSLSAHLGADLDRRVSIRGVAGRTGDSVSRASSVRVRLLISGCR